MGYFLILLFFNIFFLLAEESEMPHFYSREDYILWQLADEKENSLLYYKFFPPFREKRIGNWKTTPSPSPEFMHIEKKNIYFNTIPFTVKIIPKKNQSEKEQKAKKR